MQLYANPHRLTDAENCATFQKFMERFDWAKFHQPNPAKAPWHVQCHIPTASGSVITLNFWPHKLKGQFNETPAVEGYEALRGLMAMAIDESQQEFEVLETD